jgi:hypothetical protein
MNIVFVTYHTCARASKMAQALVAAGHQVIVLQHLAASEEILYDQQLSAFYRGQDDLAKKIKSFNEWADVFHVHNEPDWPVWVTAENTDCPVVYDCHDLDSQRKGEANTDETKAFAFADGFVFPSDSYLFGAAHYHKTEDRPAIVLHSKCTQADIEYIRSFPPKPGLEAMVYEGHHVGPMADSEFKPGHPNYYGYRDYREFVGQCSARHIPVALYGTRPSFDAAYRSAGALTNPMLPFRTMLHELTRYRWGFCGHPDDHPQWQKAMPNKLFEYLAAGLPVIAWNCKEVSEYIEKFDVGLTVDSYDGLLSAFADRQWEAYLAHKVRKHVDDKAFTLDSDIVGLVKMYAKLVYEAHHGKN